MLREDRSGTAQADLRRARDTGRTGSVEVDVVGGKYDACVVEFVYVEQVGEFGIRGGRTCQLPVSRVGPWDSNPQPAN